MSFQKSEIIVCDGAKFPDSALVVDGYDLHGNLLAHPLGGGFQLIIPPAHHSRFETVPDEERMPIFKRARFALDGLDETFPGWTDGRHWNGWAMPRFEFAAAVSLITALGMDENWYDPAADAFITYVDAGEVENWPSGVIYRPEGGTVKAYPVGAGSWIWEECE